MPAPNVADYSRFTQTAVKAWDRLMEPRSVFGGSVPWVVIWGAATGVLLALQAVHPPIGNWLAGLIFVGAALNAAVAHTPK